MANRTEHILVTGGAGFIGSHLVGRLLDEGKSVTVIDDCSTGRLENLQSVRGHPELTVVQARVSQCGNLAEMARECRGIYHLAAAVGVDLVMHSALQTIESNLRETQLMLDAASEVGGVDAGLNANERHLEAMLDEGEAAFRRLLGR